MLSAASAAGSHASTSARATVSPGTRGLDAANPPGQVVRAMSGPRKCTPTPASVRSQQLLEPVRWGPARQVAEERVPPDGKAVRPRPGVPALLRDLRQRHERQQGGDEDPLRGTVRLSGAQQEVVGDVRSDLSLHVLRVAEPRTGERPVERRDIEPVKRVGNDRGDGLAECGRVPRVGAQHGTELRPRGRDPVRVSREQLAVVPVEQLRRHERPDVSVEVDRAARRDECCDRAGRETSRCGGSPCSVEVTWTGRGRPARAEVAAAPAPRPGSAGCRRVPGRTARRVPGSAGRRGRPRPGPCRAR